MPEEIVSSDQIDDWLSTLGDEGIEVVDSGFYATGATVKVPTARVVAKVPEVIEEEEEATAEEGLPRRKRKKREEEFDGGYSQDQRPGAHGYLRKMGCGLLPHLRGRG